jgi:hypothetical protein
LAEVSRRAEGDVGKAEGGKKTKTHPVRRLNTQR